MKNIILIILGVIIGVIGTLSMSDNSKTVIKEVTAQKLVEIASESNSPLNELGSIDLKKAEEVYGKAFNLFLVSLGLKLSLNKREELQKLLKKPEKYIPERGDGEGQNYIPREIDFKPSTWFKDFVQREKADLKNIEDDKLLRDVQDFMLNDPALYYSRSTYIQKFSEVKKIMGEYAGVLYRIAGNNKGRVDQVYMNVNFSLKEEDLIEGTFSLKLSNDGDVYSNSQGDGGNGNIRFKGTSILIEAGPNSFFHFRGSKIDVANFYEDGKLAGVVRFRN
jgi:hypothetical protein